MRRLLLASFFAALSVGSTAVSPSTSSAQPRTPTPDRPGPSPDRPGTDRPAPQDHGAQPAQQQPGICCCRTWSHGWQYGWRQASECARQNGTCVTPDHC